MPTSYLLRSSVTDNYGGDIEGWANSVVAEIRSVGYAAETVDYILEHDGRATLVLDIPFDVYDDEDVEDAALSVTEDIMTFGQIGLVADDILTNTGDDDEL